MLSELVCENQIAKQIIHSSVFFQLLQPSICREASILAIETHDQNHCLADLLEVVLVFVVA